MAGAGFGERIVNLEQLIGGPDGVLVRQGVQEHQLAGLAKDMADARDDMSEVKRMMERVLENSEASHPRVESARTVADRHASRTGSVTISFAPQTAWDAAKLTLAMLGLLGLPVASVLTLLSQAQSQIEAQTSHAVEQTTQAVEQAVPRAIEAAQSEGVSMQQVDPIVTPPVPLQ